LVLATGSTTPRNINDWMADVANVLAFGADPSGVADSTAAFQAAVATGRNVYIPKGNYIIRNRLTTAATGQEIYGDGRLNTTLQIDQTFNASATCVIGLFGREHFSPHVHDLCIMFAQPSDVASRTTFKTLAEGGTSGLGGTGIKYPPAFGMIDTNRFKIDNVKIGRAWDGIVNIAPNICGGFFISNLEISIFNVGLWIDQCWDFGHITNLHQWFFDLTTSQANICRDGQVFSFKLGENGSAQGISITDCCVFRSRVSIKDHFSTVAFSSLMLDASRLEVVDSQFVQIVNCSVAGTPELSGATEAQIVVTGGYTFISNLRSQGASGVPAIRVAGGRLHVANGWFSMNDPAARCVVQSAGILYMHGSTLAFNTVSDWTVPVISVTGGVIHFVGNTFESASPGDIGGLVTIDAASNVVTNNLWNGWTFTAPGPLGDYGFNSGKAPWGKQLTVGTTGQGGRIDFRRGSDGAATGWVGMSGASSTQHMDVTNVSGSSQVRLNGTAADVFLIGGTEIARVETAGLTMASGNVIITSPGQLTLGTSSIRAGTGAPTGTPAAGSLWMRTDGAVGTRLYVSQGGGTWLPVAGV
jgi:hypothetical protein